jgi:hypothetical protein
MTSRGAAHPAHYRYQLHVQLLHITPMIWRRVWVESPMSLGQLHHILQAAMGWTSSHLHQFEIGGTRYSIPDPENLMDRAPVDERQVPLLGVLHAGLTFEYTYDFGDGWEHRIVVEKVEQIDEPYGAGGVEAGENACPPEDCGGSFMYQEFLDAYAKNPRSRKAASFLRWAGADFDPLRFDRRSADAALLRLAWNRWGID